MVGLGGGRGRGDGGVGSDKKEGPPDLYGGGDGVTPTSPLKYISTSRPTFGAGNVAGCMGGERASCRGICDRNKGNFRFIGTILGHELK